VGVTVATIGFPNTGLQGVSPKLANGEIASLAGAGDDPRYFQISVPVQSGNSGGALVDELGNVIGIVSAKLNASAAAGGKRGVAGECELRGQEQSAVELPGIRAGCFGHDA
jgi:S1-C subfamily serine protease